MGAEGRRGGLAYGLAAYGWWGLMPLYFKAVQAVPGEELLAQRIVWCGLVLAILLTALRLGPEVARALRSRRTVGLLFVSAMLLAGNWLIYIHGVVSHQIVQTSLGYFINPLFSVLLGMIFLGERLRSWQWLAVALATAGVIVHFHALRGVPWIALGLAGSFGLYGLVRKVVPVDAVVGLTIETAVLLPAALGYVVWLAWAGRSALGAFDRQTDVLLVASGVVTAMPLLFFGAAARRLPLSTLGFLQYLAPSMQLALAVLCYDEPFDLGHAVSFGLIWAGLAVFTVGTVLVRWDAERSAARAAALSGPPARAGSAWPSMPGPGHRSRP